MAGMRVEVPEVLWREIESLIPVPARRFRYPGRKRYSERACLEGILTVLRWGIPWAELPRVAGMPSGQTCWRRFDQWQSAGVWPLLVERLQQRLARADQIDWQRAIVDSTIVPAKRGAARSARTQPIAAGRPQSST
jgi:transposase